MIEWPNLHTLAASIELLTFPVDTGTLDPNRQKKQCPLKADWLLLLRRINLVQMTAKACFL